MKYFNNVKTIEELKKEYRKLCFKNHPDKGGSTETMQIINNEYDNLFERLKNGYNDNLKEGQRPFTETSEEYREILLQIIFLEGLEIELCGTWLWVGGETRSHKEALKEAGFKWAKRKCMWYWHSGDYKPKSRGRYDMGQIRATHGSTSITPEFLKQLA